MTYGPKIIIVIIIMPKVDSKPAKKRYGFILFIDSRGAKGG